MKSEVRAQSNTVGRLRFFWGNHKYESHYCVWVELLYGLRFVGLTWLVMKRMFKGWEGGSHEALPVLRPNSKERNTQDWAGMGGWEVFLKLAV